MSIRALQWRLIFFICLLECLLVQQNLPFHTLSKVTIFWQNLDFSLKVITNTKMYLLASETF